MRTHVLIALCAALMPAVLLAQPRSDLGRFEFDNNCASCHGPTGRGDGDVGRTIKQPVPGERPAIPPCLSLSLG
jgi:mono/diheme cytochrome c family protein